MSTFFSELKRRNVVRVAIAYVVVGWLLIQLAGVLEPALLLPDWVDRVVTVFLLIGFPILLIFAWAFEITPEGIRKTRDVDPAESITGRTGQRIGYATIVLIVVAVGFLILREVWLEPGRAAPESANAKVPSSIAVMPFEDFSPNKDQEHFSKGIAEEILNLLAKTDALRVAARTSAFALANDDISIPEIGDKLDVEAVLEGSVRTSGSQIRVTAQLIKVSDGYHIWSETYDADNTDIFEIQDKIAGQILAALRVHLLPGEQTAIDSAAVREVDLDAYDAYLIGRERLARRTRDDIVAARAKFEETLAAEPGYAPAHVGIAHADVLLEESDYGGDRKFDSASKAGIEEHLARALEIDPDSPEAIGVQGYYFVRTNRFDEARQQLNRAIELNPNYAQALSWRAETAFEQKRYLDMLADKEKAYALDPMSLQISADLAKEYVAFWRPDDAQRVIDRMFDLHPGHPLAYSTAIDNLQSHGRIGEALITTEEALAKYPDDKNFLEWQAWLLLQIGLFEDAEATSVPAVRFYAKLMQGDHGGAKALLDEQLAGEDRKDWYQHGLMYLRLAEEGAASPLFTDYLQSSLDALEEQNIDWRNRCMVFRVQDLRDAGRDQETESMMQDCHRVMEERLKAKYLCPCSSYYVVMYTVLDGRYNEAVERADQWLRNGDSSAFLEFEPTFKALSDQSEYPELLARNEAQLERQRQIYFAGRGSTSAQAY